jgi:hypothetical protein
LILSIRPGLFVGFDSGWKPSPRTPVAERVPGDSPKEEEKWW